MFSMASMTDVIFLLLIFFMVTSTFVFPSALEVNLPQSSQQTSLKPSTRLFLDKELNMYVQQGDSVSAGTLKPLPLDQLDGFMQSLKQEDPAQFVALQADEEVPYGKIVDILDKASRSGVKVVLATKPASDTYASPETGTHEDEALTAPEGAEQTPAAGAENAPEPSQATIRLQ